MKTGIVLCLVVLALGLSITSGGISRRSFTEPKTPAENRNESIWREVELQRKRKRRRQLPLQLQAKENNPMIAWEGGQVTLQCSPHVEGPVIWIRRKGGGVRQLILTANPNGVVKYLGGRFDTGADKSLSIQPAAISDSGIYFCNGRRVAKLIVNKKSKVTPNNAAQRPVETLVTAIVSSICSLIVAIIGIAVYYRRR